MKKNLFMGVLMAALVGSSAFGWYQRGLARQNHELALQNAMRAEEQAQLAQQAEQEALKQRAMAEAHAQEALRQQQLAEEELQRCRGRK